jgi:hypothetical protein
VLTGRSGVEVQVMAADQVVHEAETLYVLKTTLEVPPGESTSAVECTMAEDTTVFAVFPHMHQLGTRMRATVGRPDGEMREFFEQPYSFEEQLNYLIEPALPVTAGDVVRGECSFRNPGSETIRFGDSSDDEMCVIGVYRYPARGGLGLCFE